MEIKELEKKAIAGDARSCHYLGKSYYDGDGVQQSYEMAAIWYTKAANLGYSDSMYNLAIMYACGEGVPKNSEKAVELFEQAALKGDQDAIVFFQKQAADGNTEAVKIIDRLTEQGAISSTANNIETAITSPKISAKKKTISVFLCISMLIIVGVIAGAITINCIHYSDNGVTGIITAIISGLLCIILFLIGGGFWNTAYLDDSFAAPMIILNIIYYIGIILFVVFLMKASKAGLFKSRISTNNSRSSRSTYSSSSARSTYSSYSDSSNSYAAKIDDAAYSSSNNNDNNTPPANPDTVEIGGTGSFAVYKIDKSKGIIYSQMGYEVGYIQENIHTGFILDRNRNQIAKRYPGSDDVHDMNGTYIGKLYSKSTLNKLFG